MTLKSKFLLLMCLSVVLALLTSEWLTLGATKVFLAEHALEMRTQYGQSAPVESLQRDQADLMDHLLLVHLLIAAATICLLIPILHLLWKHLVQKRLNMLLLHMSHMERGTWETGISCAGNDEIAAMARAVNRLGVRLTKATQEFGGASKLAALALIGQSLVRDVAKAHDQLCALTAMLELHPNHREETIEPVTRSLASAISILEQVPERFQSEFDNQFQQHSERFSKEARGHTSTQAEAVSVASGQNGTPSALTSGESQQTG